MGRPKALLPYRTGTFLSSILDSAWAAGLSRHVVVLGATAHKQFDEQLLRGVEVTTNAHPEEGPIGSIKAGVLAVLNRPVEAILAWPVDQPHVKVSSVETIVSAFLRVKQPIVVPRYGQQRGHPVLFARAVFADLLSVRRGGSARDVVRADPSRVHEVLLDDPGVVEDIDTPEDYQRLLQRPQD